MQVPREALALIGAASKDPSRYQLDGINIRRNGGLEACATDGKQLTVLKWKDDADKGKDGSVILSREAVALIKKALPPKAFEGRLQLSEDGEVPDAPYYEREVFTGTATVKAECIQGKFPDYQFVLERDGRYDREFHVNPFVLMDQMKVIIGALGWTRGGVNQSHKVSVTVGRGKNGKAMPFLFRGEQDDLSVIGAVMPMVKD